jgi:hypothetical protein
MPQYTVQIPGQGSFNVNSPVELTDEQAYMAVMRQLQPPAPPEEQGKPEGGFIPATKAALSSLKSDITALAGRSGLMDLAKAEQVLAEEEKYRQKTFAPTTEGWTEAPWTKFKETLGGSLPYMAAPVAAGIAGGAGLAGMGLAGLASAGQFAGSNLSRQIEEGKALGQTDIGAAALAAVPQAALDVVSLRMIPGIRSIFGAAGKKLTVEEAEQVAKQGLAGTLGDYAMRTGKTAGVEGLTEAGQQVFERLQAGLNIADPQARAEYFDSFVSGAILGGTLGVPGTYAERGREQREAQALLAAQQPPAAPGTPAAQTPAAEEIPEPTLREAALTPQEVAAGEAAPKKAKGAKAEEARARKLEKDQQAYLKQFALLQARRAQDMEEYERIKAMTPEEYALSQLQEVPGAAKVPRGTMPEPTGIQPITPYTDAQKFAEQQISIAKEREPYADTGTYVEYLLARPDLARELAQSNAVIPGLSGGQSQRVLDALRSTLALQDKATAKQSRIAAGQATTSAQQRLGTVEEEERSALEAQRAEEARLAREAEAADQDARRQQRIQPEVEGLRRLGKVPEDSFSEANRIAAEERLAKRDHEEAMVDELIGTLPREAGQVLPGTLYRGIGGKKASVDDLRTQLQIARAVGNKEAARDAVRELRSKEAPATDLTADAGKATRELQEMLGTKPTDFAAQEAQAAKFADNQRLLLLELARVKGMAGTLSLPDAQRERIRAIKEDFAKAHADEINARRAAFGLPEMADWERGEARARAMDAMNTLDNNWGQFENPLVSVRQLQRMVRKSTFDNLLGAAQRFNLEERARSENRNEPQRGQQFFFEDEEGNRIEGKTMEVPRDTGPRIAAPDELTLRPTPRRAEDEGNDALGLIEQALSTAERRTRAVPVVTEKAPTKVGSLAEMSRLFSQEKTSANKAAMDQATVDLLERLREALPGSTNPEFAKLAREQAQQILEGNLPNPFAVRDLDEMMREQEAAGRSTAPALSAEETARVAKGQAAFQAQAQRELFGDVPQVVRDSVQNFQKLLDSKQVKELREDIEARRRNYIATLQELSQNLPTASNTLRKAEQHYQRRLKIVQKSGTVLHNFKQEFAEDLAAVNQTIQALQAARDRAAIHVQEIELIKTTLLSEPADTRFLINAQKALGQEANLRKKLKQAEEALANGKALEAAINATIEADQTLVKPLEKRVGPANKDLFEAQDELAQARRDVQTERQVAAAATAAAEERAKQAEAEAAITDQTKATPEPAWRAAIQAGREGLNLPGVRLQKDTSGMNMAIAKIRSAMGSLDEQLSNATDPAQRAELQASLDEQKQKLETVYADAPVIKTPILEKGQAALEKAFDQAQAAAYDAASARRRKRAGEKAPKLQPVKQVGAYRSAKTNRIVQPEITTPMVEAAQQTTDKLIKARSELGEVQRRLNFLKDNGTYKKAGRLTDVYKKLQETEKALKEKVANLTTKQAEISTTERAAVFETPRQQARREAQDVEKESQRFARGVEVESPNLTAGQVQALENNKLTAVLFDIAEDPNADKLNRAVAKRLATMLGGTEVVIADRLTDGKGNEVLGSAVSYRIELNRNGGLSQEVLLHEGTHAVTERVIQLYKKSPEKLTETQREAVRELEAIHKRVKENPRITSASAKGSLSEFVAEVFSNKKLQEQLRAEPWRLTDMLRNIKSIVLRLMGFTKPETETMLGASITAIDALMVPSTAKGFGRETIRNRKLSVKDIAALHTGSNSMKQFADQFGDRIKQKDRTPQDAERIANEYLDSMFDNTFDYVAKADPDKMDYKSATIMSDGKPYDADNPLHYVEADVATFVAVEAQNDLGMRTTEADTINRQRRKDFQGLVKLMSNNPSFTAVENALVAKAAAKWAVLSDKTGLLRLAEIGPNNRHPIAVVGQDAADAVVLELRAGKNLKTAFIDGLQKNADKNAKKNERLSGWKKFNQTKPGGYGPRDNLEVAADELNAGAAGTPWCTGGAVSTARSQIEKGDFYIYYENGKPQVAVRMNGTDIVGEVRGNNPNQALDAKQQAIADDFLSSSDFKNAAEFTREFQNKARMIDIAKGEDNFGLFDLLNSEYAPIDANGKVDDYAVKKFLSFRNIDGYTRRPAPSEKVVNFFGNKLKEAAFDVYERGGFIFSRVDAYGEGRTTFRGDPKPLTEEERIITVQFGGREFKMPLDNLLAAREISFAGHRGREYNLPNLMYAHRLDMHGDNEDPVNVRLPKINVVKNIVTFNTTGLASDNVLHLPRTARVGEVRAYKNAELTIYGPLHIETLDLQGSSGTDGLTVVLPDTKYFKTVNGGVEKQADGLFKTAADMFKTEAQSEGFGFSALSKWRQGDLEKTEARKLDTVMQDVINKTNTAFRPLLGTPVFRRITTEAMNDADREQMAPDAMDYVGNVITRYFDEVGTTETSVAAVADALAKIYGKPADVATSEVTAPNFIAETPPVQTLTETDEQPVFARAQATGMDTALNTAKQMLATPKTIRERVDANLGLGFRTQALDRLAPLEKIAYEMMDPLKGMQMMSYLRFADQKMSFVQGSVGIGAPKIVAYDRQDGRKEYIVENVSGPNLSSVVLKLRDTPNMNAEAANQLFTLYLAGKRGERVGYNKLNFKMPADQIKAAVNQIESDEGVRKVFEEARSTYNKYNRNLMKFLEETGALSAQEAKRLSDTDDYIPFYREENGYAVLVVGGEGTFRIGNLKDQPQLKELIGGEQKILDFMTSSVQNTSMIIDIGLRNLATKNAMSELQDLGLAQVLGSDTSGPDIVTFKDKGVPKYVRVETDSTGIPAQLLVKGMEGIPVNNSALVRALGYASAGVRKGVMLNPLYPVKQLFRDSVAAPLVSGADFAPVLGALKQIGSVSTKRTLESRGVVGGQVFTGTNEDLTRILKDLQAGKIGLGQLVAKAEAIAMEADALTRRAQYDSYIKQGLSQMEATLMSLESMNFSRKGLSPSARFLATTIPFFNAQVQSLDALYRSLRGKMPMSKRLDIQGKLIRRGALLAGTAVAYALLMQDDPAYKNATPEQKYNNFFVRIPGLAEPLRFPVPFEVGYLFKSLPEAIVNGMAGGPKAERDALEAFRGIALQTIPGGTSLFLPAALKPIVENVANYSFFTQGQLEGKREQSLLPEYRYRDTTAELAKGLGMATGTSPIKIENLVRGYLGPAGMALMQAFDFAMPKAGGPEQATKRLSETAVIGPLFQPNDAKGVINAVYDRVTDINQIKSTYNDLLADGKGAEARAFLQQNINQYAQSAVAGNFRQQMETVTKAENAIKASSYSAEKKREMLDRLRELKIKMAGNTQTIFDRTTPQ